MADTEPPRARNFIQELIDDDLRAGKWAPAGDGSVVRTRFPPEPNGYLHIGHGKTICLNFGLAEQYGGQCNLRFDDTNPTSEEEEYVRAIIDDVRWLGFRWPGARDDDLTAGVLYASDYFEQMYEYAVELIRKGKAYVDDLSPAEIRDYRGTLTRPGRDSPHRGRSVEESLDLFARMRAGAFPDGSKTLRAKIDMASPNMNLRDPVMYRILHAEHHRAGSAWCVYPMYDWAHGLEDAIEGVTHSICTLEFENHRPLYDWFLDAINEGRTDDGAGPWGKKIVHPQQIEFARLNLNYTVMSKRKLLELVREQRVRGWDDPRLPSIRGLRRRGYTPESVRDFCTRVGIAKVNGVSETALLEHCLRQDLNQRAPRVMAVLRPLKVVITNWAEGNERSSSNGGGHSSALPAGTAKDVDRSPSAGSGDAGTGTDRVEWLDAINNPEDPAAGTRKAPFSRTLYIERDDFLEDPPRKFFRLAPGREVRLRYAYFITCREVIKDDNGRVVELRCTYDPATRGGDAPDGRKVKGTLHWVCAAHALDIEVRLYDHLFTTPNPEDVTEVAAESEAHARVLGAAEGPENGEPESQHAATAAGANPKSKIQNPKSKGDAGARIASRTPIDWKSNLNPDSLQVLTGCKLEPNWRDAADTARWSDGVCRVQFERRGYFCVDPDSDIAAEARDREKLVFNRTVTLRDTWAKIAKRTQ